ncbi:hypothetical protein VdG1_02190 [Verticillium dahliae VDG1]|nr:hypothetical protein VdG1_02190 [Verticillium dahliae VDG1]
MPTCPGFNSSVSMTFIGTATAILDIDGVKFLTDPFFAPAKTSYQHPERGFHIAAAIMNIGDARFQFEPEPAPKAQITMGGKDAAQLFRAIKADWIVPMHFDGWDHFTQYQQELTNAFEEAGVHGHVIWLKLGEPVKIL